MTTTRHVFGDTFLAFVSARLALRGSDIEPGVRGYVVLGHTLAVGVHEPENELRGGVTLLGGEAEPPHRLGVVLGHTLAAGVHDPEVVRYNG